MIRVFIAIELPDDLKQQIAALQADLKRSGADVKWVEPKNLHLTLKFLGNIEADQAALLAEALKSVTCHLSPVTCHFEGIGAFPRTTSPRVIWVGISQGKDALTQLAGAVEEACVRLGFPKEERPFSPHLTIGRVRARELLAALVKMLQLVEFRAAEPMRADRLNLFQSTLSPKGPAYTPLADLPLGRTPLPNDRPRNP